jgi:hypothetical protein
LAVVGEEQGVHQAFVEEGEVVRVAHCWMALEAEVGEALRGHCLRVLKAEEGAAVVVRYWRLLGVGVAEE